MTIQGEVIRNVVQTIVDLIEKEIVHNESTFKNNFFYHLKEHNKTFEVVSEKNISQLTTKCSGFLDYYMYPKKKSRSNKHDVGIEFKINCMSKTLIKHDLDKLDKFSKLHKGTSGIFIDYFFKKIDFWNLSELKKMFYKTDAFVIIICKGFHGFHYRKKKDIEEYETDNLTFIFNSTRMESFLYEVYDLNSGPFLPSQSSKSVLIIKYPNKKGGRKETLLHYRENKKDSDMEFYISKKLKYYHLPVSYRL